MVLWTPIYTDELNDNKYKKYKYRGMSIYFPREITSGSDKEDQFFAVNLS